MTDTEPKKELSPEEIEFRRARGMSNRQMLGRLKRIVRTDRTNIRAAWAAVLAAVLENTHTAKLGGKMEPFLR